LAELNLMKHFVVDENGTSCLLATILDPCFADPRQAVFRESFRSRLLAVGIDVSTEMGPSTIRPEYLNVDLAMLWGDWIVLLENKVAAASITRNQLAIYYDIALKQMQSGSFLDVAVPLACRIAVVYLTPVVTVGAIEFASLTLRPDRRDAKLHLAWADLIDDAWRAFPGTSTDSFGKLVVDGVKRTAEILSTRPIPKIAETPARIATISLLRAIRGQVIEMMAHESDLRLLEWLGENQGIYGNIGGSDANVYLNDVVIGADALDPSKIRLRAVFSFRAAERAPKAKRDLFAAFRTNHWEQALALPAGTLAIDKRGYVIHEVLRDGVFQQIVDDLAALFCRFLSVLRPYF
jgi:PD-(D/E)XK nuclease superfamily